MPEMGFPSQNQSGGNTIMKNRLICLALCLVFVLSAFLTGCGEKSTGEITEEIIITSSENARTLTMWLVAEKAVDAATAEAVTKAINDITETKFSTRLVLKFFTEDEYRQAVTEEIRRNEDARNELLGNKAPSENSSTSTQEETIEYITNEYGQLKKKYPELVSNQVDIIYIAGYDMYTEFIDNGWLYEMDGELSAASKKIKEYISATLLGAAKIDGSTYAIPNNNSIGEYTYMLLDKELMQECSTDGIYDRGEINGFFNDHVFLYLETIRQHYGDAVVPIDATYEECMELLAHYWTINPDDYTVENTNFSLFGYRYTDPATLSKGKTVLAFNSLFGDPVFRQNYLKLNEFKLDGGYFGEAVEGKKTAVKFAKGDITAYESFKEDYYPVIVKYPSVNVEDVYENMMGVCQYSVDKARCMQILTYLNTNSEIRNILQYGVEGENFQVNTDAEGNKSVERLNDAYMMDIYKTGNAFLAYPDPAKEMAADIWDVAKQQNRQALVEPLLNFNFKEIVDNTISVDTTNPKLGSVGYTYTYTTGYSKEILAQDPLLKKFFEESDKAGEGVYVYHTSRVESQNLFATVYYYNNSLGGATVEVTDGDETVTVAYTGGTAGGETITVISFFGKKNSSNLKWTATVNGEAVECPVKMQNSVLNFNFMETETYRIELSTDVTKAMIVDHADAFAFVKSLGTTATKATVGTYEKAVGDKKLYTYLFYLPSIAKPGTVSLQPTGTASRLDLAVSYTTNEEGKLSDSAPKYSMFLLNVYADAAVEVNFNLTVNGVANDADFVALEKDPDIAIRGELDLYLVKYFNRLSAEVETLLNSCTDMAQLTAIVNDLGVMFKPIALPSEEIFSVGSKLVTDEVKALMTSAGGESVFYWNLYCATSKTEQVRKEDDGSGKLAEITNDYRTGESYHYYKSPYMLYYAWLKDNGYAK